MPSTARTDSILILEPDRLRATVVAQAVSRALPRARVYCESDVAVAARILEHEAIALFVVGLGAFDLDVLVLLGACTAAEVNAPPVLVMTADPACPAVRAAESLPIAGVFDFKAGDLVSLERVCIAAMANNSPARREPADRPARASVPGWAVPAAPQLLRERHAPPVRFRRSGGPDGTARR